MTGKDDAGLARDLATAAGELLLRLRADMGFGDPWALRDAGDKRSHEFLAAELGKARPGDVVLSEEAADDRSRLTADRVWIIDPLDGTTEFGETLDDGAGRTDWAVHVALWERSAGVTPGGAASGGAASGGAASGGAASGGAAAGGFAAFGLTAGAVALPARGLTLSTADPLPARPAPQRPARLAVSRSRRPLWFDRVAGAVGGVAAPIGSAGMKAMSVVLGEADAYLHSGRMKEWDSAAPVAVARAAGLHVSRLDGSALEFNTPERLTLDLVICHPDLTDALLAAAAGIGGTDTAER